MSWISTVLLLPVGLQLLKELISPTPRRSEEVVVKSEVWSALDCGVLEFHTHTSTLGDDRIRSVDVQHWNRL